MTTTLPPALVVQVLRSLLPEGWEIVRMGETTERPLDEQGASEWLHCGVDALRRHRTNGTGPQFRKIGRSVVYMPSDLAEWVQGIEPQKSTVMKP